MGYATKEDIDELYGTDLLVRVADYNRDGTPDDDVVAKGLLAADEICNAYLSAEYAVPVVPTPGKSFREAFDFKEVFATEIARLLAQLAPGMSEVCPLKELPTVEYVYVCGEKDDAIRPEWEQWAAREYLHVEPVVVRGAGHANIIFLYANDVVDAATKGL